MPCRNSSGKLAREASLTPSARKPDQVNATDTQRLCCATSAPTSWAEATLSIIPASQARPREGCRNDRNSYRPVSAGTLFSTMCWMSSNSSMATLLQSALLHLVEHRGHCAFHPQCLLDLISGDVGVFPVFQKAWALMVPKELDDRR